MLNIYCKNARWISNTCLYYQKAFHRFRPSQTDDVVKKLLNSKADDESINQGKSLKDPDKILKLPRGTQDYHPAQMKIREDVFRTIVNCFKQHGATTMDTPIMELTSLLKEKYGEDTKLIYELKDQDNESLALRYDLTVPFARYISQNKIAAMKRYHIGKVYRRDNPKMTRGRFREFYQCDFDIVGNYDSMIPDAECVKIIAETLDKLDVGQYRIHINHRKLLDAIFLISGVPHKQFRSLSSSVDKLDKLSWNVIRDEMINEKGLSPEAADKIWSYVQLNGDAYLIDKLRNDPHLSNEKAAIDAFNELELLFSYLKLFNVADKVKLDLKLARGLDYYTGVIFEAVLTQYQYNPQLDDDQMAVGSVAGGGRYDELVGKIDPKHRSIPCVGLSIGVERIFAVKEHQLVKSKSRWKTNETEVYIASAEKNFLEERIKLCTFLWENGFKSEIAYKRNPKLLDQLQYCEKHLIELCIIIGSSELKSNTIKIRNISTRQEFVIPRSELVDQLRNHLTNTRQHQ